MDAVYRACQGDIRHPGLSYFCLIRCVLTTCGEVQIPDEHLKVSGWRYHYVYTSYRPIMFYRPALSVMG